MSDPKKHHFIPQFLLAEWAVNDGKLWRFTRPYGRRIAKKLVSPAEIGYERLLYMTVGLPDEYAQQFEAAFLSKVDGRAAKTHKLLLMQDDPINWKQPDRSDWTRFIGSLLFRTPENLAAYKEAINVVLLEEDRKHREAYLRDKPADWPDSFHEAMTSFNPDFAEQAAMQILRGMIDDGERGEKFNAMVWTTGVMTCAAEFLISDALLQHTTPIIAKGGYIAMPISPKRIFVATNADDPETLDMIRTLDSGSLVAQVNKVIVSRASVFVGSTSLDQLAFVEEHFATEDHATIIKGVAKRYREAGGAEGSPPAPVTRHRQL